MVKAHNPINWQNEPSRNTPINEANLNKMDSTIGILDDRIIEQDTIKLDKSTANTMVKDISFNEGNGIFTVTLLNGSTKTLDTKLEKIATNFKYDYSTQTLILTLIDGTTQSIDMSTLVTQYEFTDSATLDFSVGSDGKITATIKSGSITGDMLQPNYLADIRVETAKSQQSMANAQTSENNAKQSELNAKKSEEKAKEYSESAQTAVQTVNGTNPTITDSTDGKLIYLHDKGYTSQDGEPTPDAPIHIASNGDKGYFDGELLQGYYEKSYGSYGDNGKKQDVCCTNPIVVNGNDKVSINYDGKVNAIRILYYDDTDTFISSEMQGYSDSSDYISSAEFTTPSNCKYIRFNMYDILGITPSTAKHICVTINGMYALRVMSCNKNLASKMIYNPTLSNYSSLIYEVGANIQKGKTYTASIDLTCDASTRAYWNVSSGIFANKDFYVSSGTNRYSYTFEALADKTDSSSILFLSKSGTSDNVRITPSNFQLEEGTVATPYEPHQSTTSLIPISSPLYDGDYIELYADGSGREYRMRKELEVTEWDNQQNTLTNSKELRTSIITDRKVDTIYCNIASYVSTTWNIDKLGICSWANAELSQISVRVPLDADKTNYPCKIVYRLATPTSTPLTAEQVEAFRQLQTFNGVTHINADGEVTVRYYCNNDSGDTMGMLHGMIEDVENKSTFISDKEQQAGYFLGKPLYRATIERTYSSINVITTGVDTPLNSSDGLIPDGSHLISGIDELVKADSLVETSTYKYVNALSIKKDKTGYYYVRNIVGEAMPATRLVITFYYTKYQGIS